MKKIISIEELAEQPPKIQTTSVEDLARENVKIEPSKYNWPYARGPDMNGFIDLSEGKGELRVLFQYADGNLFCLDKGGNQKWKVEMPGDFNNDPLCYEDGYLHNPAVTDAGIFFSTKDYLTCLDFDGKLRWEKEINTGKNILSSPVIKNNLIAVSTGRNSMLLDTDGNILWKKNISASNIGALMLDDMIIFPKLYGGIVATDYEGKKLWKFDDISLDSDVVFDKDRLYLQEKIRGDCDQVKSIDLEGKLINTIKPHRKGNIDISVPVVKDGRLYMNSTSRNWLSESRGGIFCTDRDGNIIWKKEKIKMVLGDHSEHPPTIHKDRLLIPSSRKLLCYSLDGENIGTLKEAAFTGLQPAVTDDFFVYTTNHYLVGAGNYNNLTPISKTVKNPFDVRRLEKEYSSKNFIQSLWEFRTDEGYDLSFKGKTNGRPVIYRK